MHKVLTSYPLHKFSHAVIIIIIIIIIITIWLQYTTLSADCSSRADSTALLAEY